MKKILLNLAFLLLALLAYTQQDFSKEFSGYSVNLNTNRSEMQLDFNLSEYKIQEVAKDGTLYSEIVFEHGVTTMKKGFAELPKLNATVQLQPENDVKISVIEGDFIDIQLDNPLLPSRGTIFRNQDPSKIPYEIAPESIVDAWYPEIIAENTDPFVFRDVRGISIYVFPFRYNAAQNTLRVYTSLTIVIHEDYSKSTNPLRIAPSFVDPTMNDVYGSLFINYEKIRFDNQVGQFGEMLVIYTARDAEVIQPYINWKTQKGFIVHTLEVAAGTNVKTHIQEAYDANPNLLYVQLVGDWDEIQSDAATFGMVSNAPMDPMMGCVVGTDLYPELIIGRFSANNTTHVTTQVNKAINYEKNSSTSDTWFSNGLGLARNEGAGSGDDGEGDDLHMERIRDRLLTPSYNYTTVYQEYDGGSSYVSSNTDAATISSRINSGVSIINFCNHGSETGWSVGNYSNTHVNSLTNDNKFPFIFSVACVVGRFNRTGGDCFAETWLKKEGGGAVVTNMSTINQPWVPPMRAQDYFNDIIIGGYDYTTLPGNGISTTIDDKRTTFGSIAVNGNVLMLNESSDVNTQNTIKTWTIFGDASLQIRTDTPQEMVITHNPSMFLGSTSFTVNCDTDNAIVAISYIDGEGVAQLLGAALAQDGTATVEFDAVTEPLDLTVTVTAYNKVTYEGEVSAVPADEPYVVLESFTTSDSPDYGQSTGINIVLENISETPYTATGVQAVISTESEYVNITDGSVGAGTIEPEEQVSLNNAFEIEISNDVPDQTSLVFTIDISGEYGGDIYEWSQSFTIKANAPSLSIGTLTIDDSSGNGDGIIDPGETADLVVIIHNNGAAAVSNVDAEMIILGDGANYLTINSTDLSATSIPAGESVSVTFNVTADGETSPGTPVDFTVSAAAGAAGQYTASDDKQVIIGFVPEYCESYATSSADSDLTGVVFGDLVNYTDPGGSYDDFTDDPALIHEFVVGETYDIEITLGTAGGTYTKGAKVFIDWNYNGDFEDEGETVFTVNPDNANWTATGQVTIPADAPLGPKFMRVVVRETNNIDNIQSCGSYTWGGTEDYKIILVASGPNANFTANPTSVLTGETVTFTDASSGDGEAIESWSWDFGAGASPATATGAGPHEVVYNTPGSKTASLTIEVGGEEYTRVREDYINVGEKVDVFPFAESFEGVFPPEYWVHEAATANTWDTSTGYVIGTEYPIDPQDGSQFAFVQWHGTAAQDEWLITPVFDLSSLSDGELSFWFNGSYEWSVNQDNCDLLVKVSVSGGAWQTIWSEHDHPDFINDDATYVWHETILDLENYEGHNHVRFAFVYEGSNGANFNVDNVQITGSTLPVPTITQWPTATGIDYGELLEESALSGDGAAEYEGEPVPGEFHFTFPDLMPTAGTYEASVTFTPNDQETYSTVTGTVEVAVAHRELTLTGSFTVEPRPYDGTTEATVQENSLEFEAPGIVTGDEVDLALVLAFADPNANTDIPVSITGATELTGGDAGNYTLSLVAAPASTGNITQRQIEVTADDKDKVYNDDDPEFTSQLTDGNLIGEDGFTGDLTRDPGENVGEYSITQGDLTAGPNYSITFKSGTLTILQRPVEVVADDKGKVYGEPDVELTYQTNVGKGEPPILNGELSREEGEDVESYEIQQGTLEANSNYELTFVPATFTITQRPIVVKADNKSKEYGQEDVELTHTITSGSLAFEDEVSGALTREAGEAVGDYAITQGTITAGSNYDLTFEPGVFTITQRVLTITVLDVTKAHGQQHTFDGTEFTADGLLPNGVDEVASVTLTSAGSASGAALGDYDIVPSDAQGANLDNYDISYINGTMTVADLIELTLTGLTVHDRVYDGSTDATVDSWGTLVGIDGDDEVTLDHSGAQAAFLSRHAGSGKEVRVTGLALDGVDAGDYFINFQSTTASIQPKELTVTGSFTVQDRVYDATTDASIASGSLALQGVVSPDQVELEPAAAFSSKTVGTAKTASLTEGSQLLGVHAQNYALSLAGAPTAVAAISRRDASVVSATAQGKTYDGTTQAVVVGAVLEGIITGDAVTLADHATGTFAQADAGEGIPVSTAMTLTGTDAGNYRLYQPAGLSASITPKELTVGGSFTAQNREYDGTTEAAMETNTLTLIGMVTGEAASLVAVLSFESKDIGDDKTVALTEESSLADKTTANYVLSLEGAPTATATINPKELMVTGAEATSKIYDGTTQATISGAELQGAVANEEVTLENHAEGTFAQVDVGEGVAVTTAMTISGVDAGNYTLAQPSGLSADITPREITVTGAQAQDKEYDGTAVAEITGAELSGALEGDMVVLESYTEGTFAQVGVGADLEVITSMSLAGADAGNYSLTQPELTASITARTLTLGGSFEVADKEHDGTTEAEITESSLTLEGLVAEDQVTLNGVVAEFAQAEVGTDILVTIVQAEVAGEDSPNYSLSLEGAPTTTARIYAYYMLTLQVSPEGSGEVVGAGEYVDGEEVEIAATPAEGYMFEAWLDEAGAEVSALAAYTYTMPAADITLTARFVPCYAVTFHVMCDQEEPIDGAMIMIADEHEMFTDADGEAAVELADGHYAFTVIVEGYEPYEGELTVDGEAIEVTVQMQPVGAEHTVLANLNVYPNPFSNTLNLVNASEVNRVTFTNIIGQLVKEVVLSGSELTLITTEDLPKGVYLISFEDKNRNKKTFKMIKQ